ncbi:MAG: hypothetical protein IPL96_12305 [Holophagaceae bacterium]|nr:hypothetical protein [Holophagaceae bacterium]
MHAEGPPAAGLGAHGDEGCGPYPGRCRQHSWEGFERALRFRLPRGSANWVDLVLGPQLDDPEVLTGDPLLFRRDGCFAYHLAVVVDDGAQGVTEVVRGSDLRSVTATQVRLQEALGLPPSGLRPPGPVTSDGARLGKRAGALGLEALKARGVGLPEIVGWLGWVPGCLEAPMACAAPDLVPELQLGQGAPGELPFLGMV